MTAVDTQQPATSLSAGIATAVINDRYCLILLDSFVCFIAISDNILTFILQCRIDHEIYHILRASVANLATVSISISW